MRPLLTFLIVLLAVPTQAQTRDAAFAEAADAFVAETLGQFGTVPGLAVAVVRDGRTVYARGFGFADVEAGIAVTPDTPFYIASATKPFTALLAALLGRDGTLSLDVSLASLFPGVRFDPAIEADSVTVRQLLSHTSGLVNDPIGFRAAYSGEHTPETMRRLLGRTTRAEGAPRGEFDYTNIGYNILSLRLDELPGGPWQSLLAARVFQLLGMTHTTAYASEAALWSPAVPYTVDPERGVVRLDLVKHDDTMQAAGGMYASANDLARWVLVQMNEGRLDGRQIFPADVIAETHRPVATGLDASYGPLGRDGYALGWYTGTYRGEPMIHHLGGFAGFHAHTSFMPGRDVGVMVLANESETGGRLATLVAGFTYDWWAATLAEADSVALRARREMDNLHARYEASRERAHQDLRERAERTWQLSLAPEAYTGVYVNADYGTLVVEQVGGALAARLGRLYAIAEPFTEPETARVELIPGQGQVLTFRLDTGHIAVLEWDGETFERVASHPSGK